MTKQDKDLYELKALVVQAAAHPIRLAVVDFLRDGEQCVCDISAHVGAKRSNVSRHLAVMLRSGVLDCRKDGLKVLYSLRAKCITKVVDAATDVLRCQARQNHSVLKTLGVSL
jgi:DNA-binding transcriptional ArsR family regulator